MKKLFAALLAVSLVCAAAAAWSGEPEATRKYASVHVSKFVIDADMDRDSPEEVKYYADLETEATNNIVKWFRDQGYAIAPSADASDSKQLTIRTSAKFNPGNQAVRWVGGLFGAGKATAAVTMEAVESASGSVVSTQTAENSMRMGGLGGNAGKFLIGVVDSAWNQVVEEIGAGK